MFPRRTYRAAVVTIVAACLAALCALPAAAAPSSTQLSADRAAVDRAVQLYEQARERSASLNSRISKTSRELDDAVARETAARDRLSVRVVAIYRSPDVGFVSALLGSATIQDLVTRWDALSRIARRDAETLRSLKAARIEAQASARELMNLQAEEARSLDELADRVAAAKKELATSEAAVKEYEARTAAKPKPTAAPAKSDPTQRLSGSGAWQTAVASHYGRNFTGRGASGERIGPYSMIVAHKTLPFGTLVEIEYNGRRAVARVADRGPFTKGRTFDLGPGLVRVLGFSGVHEVRYRIIAR